MPLRVMNNLNIKFLTMFITFMDIKPTLFYYLKILRKIFKIRYIDFHDYSSLIWFLTPLTFFYLKSYIPRNAFFITFFLKKNRYFNSLLIIVKLIIIFIIYMRQKIIILQIIINHLLLININVVRISNI